MRFVSAVMMYLRSEANLAGPPVLAPPPRQEQRSAAGVAGLCRPAAEIVAEFCASLRGRFGR
jgi:hypothetical protein